MIQISLLSPLSPLSPSSSCVTTPFYCASRSSRNLYSALALLCLSLSLSNSSPVLFFAIGIFPKDPRFIGFPCKSLGRHTHSLRSLLVVGPSLVISCTTETMKYAKPHSATHLAGYTNTDSLGSNSNSSPGSRDVDPRHTTSNTASSNKISPMLDHFLKESAKEGHFTGLGKSRVTDEKFLDKKKL
jgi:hypothetical protein